MRLRITANIIIDEGIRMGSESSAKLSTNCWCWRTFFVVFSKDWSDGRVRYHKLVIDFNQILKQRLVPRKSTAEDHRCFISMITPEDFPLRHKRYTHYVACLCIQPFHIQTESVADPGGRVRGLRTALPSYQTWRLFETEILTSTGSYISF